MNVFPKNLIVYSFSRDIGLTNPNAVEKLEKLLAEFAFKPCGGTDKVKFGFTPPMGDESECFVHAAEGNLMIRALKQTKAISAAAFNKKLAAKKKEVEAMEQRPLKKKEIDNMKDELMMDLLPHALPVDKFTNAFIINQGKYLVIDASSYKAAEDFSALLRKAIGSLPITPVECTKGSAESIMTEWVKTGEVPQGFSLGTSAVLKSVLEEGGLIRCKNQELTSDEVLKHIESDKLVTQLALDWQERVTFNIKDDLSITGMKFSDDLKDQNDDIAREEVAARFDADFALVVGEVTALIKDLDSQFSFYVHENNMKPSELPEPQPKEEVTTRSEAACESVTITSGDHSVTITTSGITQSSNEIDLTKYDEVSQRIIERLVKAVGEEEPLMKKMICFVVDSQRASVSALQRQFKIGYNRAARAMEIMENFELVSRPGHNGGREVLVEIQEA